VLVVMPFQGIFLNRGNIRVWFTNDDRRIPVRMKAKVIIRLVMAISSADCRPHHQSNEGISLSLPTQFKTVILASTMGRFPLTLSRFINQKQAARLGATGEFASLLAQIGLVGKLIAQDLRRAGLMDILGTTGEINVQGETVKKLDEIANETFLKVFHQSGLVCALASEEMEKPILLGITHKHSLCVLSIAHIWLQMPLGAIFPL
jgi:hypothetical protein